MSKSKRSARSSSRKTRIAREPFPEPEQKYVDVNDDSNACDTTGSLILLNGIAPGVAANQRVGKRYVITHIHVNGRSEVTAGTGVDQYHRVLIVRDRQPNGAAPAITDVIVSASIMECQPNLSYAERFEILYDNRYYLNATAEPGSGKVWSFDRTLRIPVTCNAGTAGTVADITTNSLYALFIGSQAAGVTAGNAAIGCRLRFVDA